jgi:hypothetical protein
VDGGIGAPRINRSLSQILSLKNNPETINQKEAKFTQTQKPKTEKKQNLHKPRSQKQKKKTKK